MGKQLGRRLLGSVATIVTLDSTLRWHRQLIAAKWTYSHRRVGRRGVMREISSLAARFAGEPRIRLYACTNTHAQR